jgi:hypothetical protein
VVRFQSTMCTCLLSFFKYRYHTTLPEDVIDIYSAVLTRDDEYNVVNIGGRTDRNQ